MSLTALLDAVAARIKDQLNLTSAEIGVQDDAQPDPNSGKRFFSVYAPDDGWQAAPGELMMGIHEVYKVNVCLTMRLQGISKDNVPRMIYQDYRRSMDALLRKVMVSVHQNCATVLVDTNQGRTFGATEANLVEPLRWEGTDAKPRVEDGTWVYSDDEKTIHYPAALVQEVRFGQATRLQSFNVME